MRAVFFIGLFFSIPVVLMTIAILALPKAAPPRRKRRAF